LPATILEEALHTEGFRYKTNSRSIITDCPSCGKAHKLWMIKAKTLTNPWSNGQCWACGTTFNSFTLLEALGLEKARIKRLLGLLNKDDITYLDNGMVMESLLPELLEQDIAEIEPVPEIVMPKEFFTIDRWPAHMASQYAIGRGVMFPLWKQIYIDPLSNAVVFPVHYLGDTLVGYQKRYVKPAEGMPKTKTSANIPGHSSVMILRNKHKAPVVIVEGPFDAVAAYWFGFTAICCFGASVNMTKVQIAVTEALTNGQDCLYLGFDKDEAGEIGSVEAARCCDALDIGYKRVVPYRDDCKDFGEALAKARPISADKIITIPLKGHIDIVAGWSGLLPVLQSFGSIRLA
jgi:hypothetical protein